MGMKKAEIDFSIIKGKIKPLHGVNNGPCTGIFTQNTSRWFADALIPYARLQDTEGPYGAGHFVDVPAIFKDFNADPENPDSYHFEHTDVYLKAIRNSGTDIIYRLGVTRENWVLHGGIAINIQPPENYVRWARICAGIIRHYNEGWANGFHMNIQYWEIWNEPESKCMWTGTSEEFNEFYATVAVFLKQEFPELKFGGCGNIGFYPVTRGCMSCFDKEEYATLFDRTGAFLSLIKKRKAPLDFFSWHLYSGDPEEYRIHTETAACLMKEYGFENTELILDEWNHENIDVICKLKGAALAAAVLCVLQDTSVEIANYYDAQCYSSYNGLFGIDEMNKLIRLKAYYAMLAFGQLYRLGNNVFTECDAGIYGCAAIKGAEAAVLIVNYNDREEQIRVDLSGLPDANYSVTTCSLDEENNLEPVKHEVVCGGKYVLYNTLQADTVVLLKIKQRPLNADIG